MRIFPLRDPAEKREDVVGWSLVTLFWAALAVGGIGLFALSGGAAGSDTDTFFGKLRWGGLVIGAIAVFLTLQSVFHVVVEATIGSERFLAIFIGLVASGGLMKWLSDW